MTVTKSAFGYFQTMVKEASGIVLAEGKEYLVESRLTPVLKQHGLASLEDLVVALNRQPRGDLRIEVVEAMTTNETSFFRDQKLYEGLWRSILPQIIKNRESCKTLRIWSAASSSGQEPYSVAMILRDRFPGIVSSWRIEILATDINRSMIARCKLGRYSQLEVNRGLPASMLVKHFERDGVHWVLKPELRGMVDFQIRNLVDDPYTGTYDIVFLRNVLIYFDRETQARILDKVRRTLGESGVLFVGNTETTLLLDDRFKADIIDGIPCYRSR